MSEPRFGVVEDTLFMPMLGRIYASENCRDAKQRKREKALSYDSIYRTDV
jgi:hypothetical protein